jgi:hypothetical protein
LLSEEERQELDWRWEDAKEIQDPPDREVLESPFIAAEEYVGKQLGKFFSDDAYASTPERSPADQGG